MKFYNTFSWSLARGNLFNFCERAYYFHYYASWNGWNRYAPQESRDAFRLKHLRSKEQWRATIFKKALINTISDKNNLSTNCQKILSHDISSLHQEEWKYDPKRLCIKGIYYEDNSLDEIISWAKENIHKKVAIFQNSKPFVELTKIPYSAYYDTSKPLSFKLNDIQVWCSPDLIWDFQGEKHIMNLEKTDHWSLRAGLNILYADQISKLPLNKILCHTLFFDESSCYSVYGIRSPREIEKIITVNSKEMLSRLTIDQKAYPENFTRSSDSNKCKHCSFREICA